MPTLQRRLLAAVLVSLSLGSSLRAQTKLPAHAIAQLRPFAGHWSVEQVLWRPGGQPDTTHLDAVIEFSGDSSTLIVRESTADGRYHFVGFHAYDAASGRYVNWGISSDQGLGWATGTVDGADLLFTGAVRFLQTGDTIATRGRWRVVGKDEHIYEGRGLGMSDSGPPLKRDVYRRKPAPR